MDDIVVEEPKDAGEGQTAAEREEAEQEEAGVCRATALFLVFLCSCLAQGCCAAFRQESGPAGQCPRSAHTAI